MTSLLRITESRSSDVGRQIVRLDPSNFKKLGISAGDILEIENQEANGSSKKAVARAMPSYPEERDKKSVQVDGIIRDNIGAGLGEKVRVRKTSYDNARTVVLSPIDSSDYLPGEDSNEYLASILEGTPVIKDSKLRVNFFGSGAHEFVVSDTDPEGAVIIGDVTQIKVKDKISKEEEKVGITYEDIGGLSKEIQKIREIIELPMKYPEVFKRLGIDAPKGVLLHGPPGCGKTLIAKAVANETDAYFTSISGPEIMGKFYGESEGRLREIFESAADNAPSIIFIDEIDGIAPKREEMGGEKQVERRVVAQLLALMDGLNSKGDVVVIGATNIPNSLDPALRRPGRFDREIIINTPDKNARREILDIYTRGMPLAKDVDLGKLAEITHGFVGADVASLCREAAMASLRSILPEIEFEKEYIPYKKLLELNVTADHFKEALKSVEPSALREFSVEIPNVKWEDVGGLQSIKDVLIENIEWPLKHSKFFEQINLKPAKGVLLYGSPGCGKTLLAKAVASELQINFIAVKGPQLLSKYIGESERAVREVFKKAKQASPCIIFFDELDSLVPNRSDKSDSQVTERVVSQFLTELDGIEEMQGVIILGATNRLDLIDSALLRPGRFDFLLEIPKPDHESRLEIFKIHTRGKPLSNDVNLKRLAKATEGLSGADIASICQKASMAAVRETLRKNHDRSKCKVTSNHFQENLKM